MTEFTAVSCLLLSAGFGCGTAGGNAFAVDPCLLLSVFGAGDVRATAVGRGAERDAERNAVLAGDPKRKG